MKQTKQARTMVLFNTGTRIHKPKKGKGSYSRESNKRYEKSNNSY
jgi:stalled ribosome alternative rescue factor ArfA